MTVRMRNHEKATSTCKTNPTFPLAASVLFRLIRIDYQLSQVEKKIRPQESCFTSSLRERSIPLSPTMDDVHLIHALMDRVQFLETKIRQLSNEQPQDGDTSCRAITSPTEKQKQKQMILKRVLRCMRSCIFCNGDDRCCMNSSSSDDCDGQGIHAGCYH